MKIKVNLALLPSSPNIVNGLINYANLHASLAEGYLLGERSLPHITIHQFMAHDVVIEDLIECIKKSRLPKTIELELNKFSCLSFDGHSHWTSLLPNHRDTLLSLHHGFAKLLSLPIKPNYDPHLTLFRTLNPNYEQRVNETKKTYTAVTDTFRLALGKSDPLGQFTEVIIGF